MRSLNLVQIGILAIFFAVLTSACPFAHLGPQDGPKYVNMLQVIARDDPEDVHGKMGLLNHQRRLMQLDGGQVGGGRATCNVATALQAPPHTPAEPTHHNGAMDKKVKRICRRFLLKAMRNPDLSPKKDSVPFGLLLRAAFHDAQTWNQHRRRGGANGSLRFALESFAPPNIGIDLALSIVGKWRDDINAKLPEGVDVSWADMFQLTGALAVEVLGGPKMWPAMRVGRVDAVAAEPTTNLPGTFESYEQLACKFVNTGGYTPVEMMALTGAHTIGFVNFTSHMNIPISLSPNPFEFNNDYFLSVQNFNGLLASDNTLAAMHIDIVDEWAEDQGSFFAAFHAAYIKMGKMGALWRSYG